MYAAVSFQSGRGVTGFRVPDRGSVPPFRRHGIATLGIRVNVWARTLRALGRTCDHNRALIVGQTRAGIPLFCDALGVVSLFAICKLSATLQGPLLLQAPSLQRATDQHPSAAGLQQKLGLDTERNPALAVASSESCSLDAKEQLCATAPPVA
jgi:hypothetical protein